MLNTTVLTAAKTSLFNTSSVARSLRSVLRTRSRPGWYEVNAYSLDSTFRPSFKICVHVINQIGRPFFRGCDIALFLCTIVLGIAKKDVMRRLFLSEASIVSELYEKV